MKADFTSYVVGKKRSRDEHFMSLALEAANFALSRGDYPFGAVIAFPSSDYLIESYTVFSEKDVTNHAEMNVLRKAASTMPRGLKDCVLYSTIEPCAMCASTAALYGIREIVFGAHDLENGFVSSKKNINTEAFGLSFLSGVLSEDCYNIINPSLRKNIL